jgi:hypothetical protein
MALAANQYITILPAGSLAESKQDSRWKYLAYGL